MTARTRVLIADDHTILRAGLAMLVRAQPDLEVVAEAADGVETLEQARRTKPDVVILDLTMPRMNGFEALREMLREAPRTKVLVLTMHDDPAYGRSLLAAGALGYVTKKAADRELLRAIRAVRDGRKFVDVTQAEALLPPRATQLSRREQEVLALVALGHTHQAIADRLALSIKTVETYLARLTAKLGLRGRADLVRYALQAHAEDRFRLAVESSPSGMVMVDRDGKILLVNREIERLFGFRREELLGQPIERVVPFGARDRHPRFRADFYTAPQSRAMGAGRDLFGRRKDGTEIPVEIGLNPIETDEGLFVLASVVDISARKRAEARFRVVVEASPNGIVMVDREGTIVLVNRETERLFGYGRDELLGKSIDLSSPWMCATVIPGSGRASSTIRRAAPWARGRTCSAAARTGRRFASKSDSTPSRWTMGCSSSPPSPTSTLANVRGGAAPLERRPGAVRVRRVARPAGAAADGRQLRAAPRQALQGQTRQRRRRVHRLRGAGRQADATAHRGLVGVLAGRDPRRDAGADAGGRRVGRCPERVEAGDRRVRGDRDARRPAHGAGRSRPARAPVRQPDRQRDQVSRRRGATRAGRHAARGRRLGVQRQGQRHRDRTPILRSHLRDLPATA